jgi:hypothetical protein
MTKPKNKAPKKQTNRKTFRVKSFQFINIKTRIENFIERKTKRKFRVLFNKINPLLIFIFVLMNGIIPLFSLLLEFLKNNGLSIEAGGGFDNFLFNLNSVAKVSAKDPLPPATLIDARIPINAKINGTKLNVNIEVPFQDVVNGIGFDSDTAQNKLIQTIGIGNTIFFVIQLINQLIRIHNNRSIKVDRKLKVTMLTLEVIKQLVVYAGLPLLVHGIPEYKFAESIEQGSTLFKNGEHIPLSDKFNTGDKKTIGNGKGFEVEGSLEGNYQGGVFGNAEGKIYEASHPTHHGFDLMATGGFLLTLGAVIQLAQFILKCGAPIAEKTNPSKNDEVELPRVPTV